MPFENSGEKSRNGAHRSSRTDCRNWRNAPGCQSSKRCLAPGQTRTSWRIGTGKVPTLARRGWVRQAYFLVLGSITAPDAMTIELPARPLKTQGVPPAAAESQSVRYALGGLWAP